MKISEIERLTKAEINRMNHDELRKTLMVATAASNRRLANLRAEDKRQDILKKSIGIEEKTYSIPALREFEQNYAFKAVHEMYGGKFSASEKLTDDQMRQMLKMEVRFLDYKTSKLTEYRKIEKRARETLVKEVSGFEKGEKGYLSAMRQIDMKTSREFWSLYGALKQLSPEDFVLGSPDTTKLYEVYEETSGDFQEKLDTLHEYLENQYIKRVNKKNEELEKLRKKVGITFDY